MSKYAMGCMLFCLVAALMVSGCAAGMSTPAGPMTPTPGFLFADVKGPLIVGDGTGTKTGTAECVSYLGLVALGDASFETAMKAGGIKKINHADFHMWNVVGVYSKITVTVYGD